METLYILSRHGPTWSEFDGRALFEQLLDLLLANGPNLERDNVKLILLKILTNTGFHLGEFYHAPRYRKKKFLAKFEIGTKIWSNSSVKILIQNLFQAVNSKKFTWNMGRILRNTLTFISNQTTTLLNIWFYALYIKVNIFVIS